MEDNTLNHAQSGAPDTRPISTEAETGIPPLIFLRCIVES